MRAFQMHHSEGKKLDQEKIKLIILSTNTYISVHFIKSGVWSPGSIFILPDKQI